MLRFALVSTVFVSDAELFAPLGSGVVVVTETLFVWLPAGVDAGTV
jgi:hypothetical protein